MKISLLLAVALLVIAGAAFAGPIEGITNELENSCFINAGTGWDVDGTVYFNGDGVDPKNYGTVYGRGHIAYVNGEGQGLLGSAGTSTVSQTIDDTLSGGWVEAYNAKEWDVNGWYHSTADGQVQIRLGYWTSNLIPKPGPGLTPDVMATFSLGSSGGEWAQFDFTGLWNVQPRWIRVYTDLNSGASGSAVDDLSFTSKCVPEPGSIAALAGGFMGLAGLALRRRRA